MLHCGWRDMMKDFPVLSMDMVNRDIADDEAYLKHHWDSGEQLTRYLIYERSAGQEKAMPARCRLPLQLNAGYVRSAKLNRYYDIALGIHITGLTKEATVSFISNGMHISNFTVRKDGFVPVGALDCLPMTALAFTEIYIEITSSNDNITVEVEGMFLPENIRNQYTRMEQYEYFTEWNVYSGALGAPFGGDYTRNLHDSTGFYNTIKIDQVNFNLPKWFIADLQKELLKYVKGIYLICLDDHFAGKKTKDMLRIGPDLFITRVKPKDGFFMRYSVLEIPLKCELEYFERVGNCELPKQCVVISHGNTSTGLRGYFVKDLQ
jgi:hypothetical protein